MKDLQIGDICVWTYSGNIDTVVKVTDIYDECFSALIILSQDSVGLGYIIRFWNKEYGTDIKKL